MKKITSIFIFLYCLLSTAVCFAQSVAEDTKPEMAVGLRSDGKIYVVVAVVVLILTGMFIYLLSLDRKISRLEKDSRNHAGK